MNLTHMIMRYSLPQSKEKTLKYSIKIEFNNRYTFRCFELLDAMSGQIIMLLFVSKNGREMCGSFFFLDERCVGL